MCGIIGVVGFPQAQGLLLSGLKRLEYRGYDSAGIALVTDAGLERRRAQGKIAALEEKLKQRPLTGKTGIGHTRWATHGIPSEHNAHPHMTEKVAVVHNGIIENYQEIRATLTKQGVTFDSETDTEVIPRLISLLLEEGHTPEHAVTECLHQLEGAYALAMIFAGKPDLLIAARKGSPLVLGYGKNAMLVGSDVLAFGDACERISYLEEGDVAVLHAGGAQVFNAEGQSVTRVAVAVEHIGNPADKGNYPHFMLKEIHEQPRVIADTVTSLYDNVADAFALPNLPFSPTALQRITLVACGTSYYAALVARQWFERMLRISTDADIASEFRYRQPTLPEKGFALFISQSGETADTLAALRYAKSADQFTTALVNVPASSMAREAASVIHTRAGTEIGVASTKAFTTQLTALACLTLALGKARHNFSEDAYHEYKHALGTLSDLADKALGLEPEIKALAEQLKDTRDMFYIGRGASFAIAYEGALKMKEISYIHAEAYAAGELKHGPLALITPDVPVVVIAPRDELFEKTASNLQETAARGGKIILFSDKEGIARLKDVIFAGVELPACHPFIAPILYAIPLQLLAYYVAVLRGADVDQPRNLAKSVTVE